MAYFDTTWYVNFGDGSTTGHFAVAKRPQNTAVVAGQLCRQFTAPAVGSERVFVCIVAGTTANTTDATWSTVRAGKTTDGTAQWQECTGAAAPNGDAANTPSWAALKATGLTVTVGATVKRNNGASYQICTTGGSLGSSEPAFSDTAGATTVDGSTTWTCIGPVGNFTGGQAPHARLTNALNPVTWFVPGNTVYVGDNHAESTSAALALSPSSALMARIICHSSSGSYPPTAPATGAVISMTSANFLTMAPQGSFYFYGISFRTTNVGGALQLANATAVGQTQNWLYFDNCSFWAAGISGNVFTVGNAGASTWQIIVFNNTTIKLAAAGVSLYLAFCHFTWRNTGQVLVSGSSVPTTLFGTNSAAGQVNTIVFEGLDLSQLTGSLFSSTPNFELGSFLIKDCKLNASTTVTTPINTGMTVQLSASAADATSYKSSRHTYEAVETTDTSAVRTGGYVDGAGQVQSRKIVTTANTQWLRPYAAQPLSIWNATTGSAVDVAVYGLSPSGAIPTNDEVWLEASYLGDASFPVGSMVTTTKDNVWDAGSAGASDSSTWAVPATTFDGATNLVALSNGNLTVTHNVTTTNAGVVSTAFRSAGKYYVEFTLQVSVTNSTYIGVVHSSFSGTFTAANLIALSTSIVTGATNADLVTNGVATGVAIGANTVGAVFCMAIDLDARLVWFRRNNGNWNNGGSANPATGVGGYTVTAGLFAPVVRFALSANTTDAVTANFGASAFAYTAPSGFGRWAEDGHVPFKLTTTLTPQMPGYLIPQVKVAKPSATFYIDPLAVVT